MNYDSENSEIEVCASPDISEAVKVTSIDLLPEKSRKKYKTAYKAFMDWRSFKNANSFSENVVLAYFSELSEKYKSSSLWAIYSMLRSTLNINHRINIENYSKLRAFLKRKAEGYRAKKAKQFTPDDINKFINGAPDNIYLATKVALIMGIMGACRANELHSMKIEDYKDLGSAILVTIPNSKSKIVRKFTITDHFYQICKKYVDLRPTNIATTSFFLNYQNGKCTAQKIGINKFGAMGKQIATFLKLPYPKMYTGHSLRRSSTTLVIDAGGNITALERHCAWKSTAVTEEYINDSIRNTMDTATSCYMEEPTIKYEVLSVTDINPNENPSTSTEILNDAFELGKSEFDVLVKKSWYVDKTLFIKALVQDTSMVLITAPRRFGKSTNMDMLKKFLEIEVNEQGVPIKGEMDEFVGQVKLKNKILFEDKDIFKEKDFFKEHFGAYPVIYVDFKRVGGNNFEKYLHEYREVLNRAFVQHSYLLNSIKLSKGEKQNFNLYYDDMLHRDLTETQITCGLEYLSKYLYKHFDKKVYVLIDEYDAPVSNIMYNKRISETDVENIVNFISDLISTLLKSNNYVARALLNAYLHVGEVLSPDGSNIIHYPFLSKKFCKYYGFTAEEVENLLEKSDLPNALMKDVKEWYNGYSAIDMNNRLIEIYSSWSILNYLDNRKLDNYWSSGELTNIENVLFHNKIQDKIKKLMDGNIVAIKYTGKLALKHLRILKKAIHSASADIKEQDVDLLVQLLYEHGYLNIESEGEGQVELKIPNVELHVEFCKALFSLDFFIRHYNFDQASMDNYTESLKCILQNEKEESFLQLAQAIKNLYCKSPTLPKREFEFQAHLFYLTQRGFPNVSGVPYTYPKRTLRPDIVICVEERTAVIFELKLCPNGDSESALGQILENKYYNVFENKNLFKIVLIGLHLDERKEITVSYLINNFDRENIKTVYALL